MKYFNPTIQLLAFFSITSLSLPSLASAKDSQICVYQDERGQIVQVNSMEKIPVTLRGNAKCMSASENQFLAKPEDIKLNGNIRKEDMSSAIGRIQLRWPRKVELLFGRTPQRAMADAAYTASRAVKASGFPPEIQTIDLDWKVVFMDEDVPETQIPSRLVSNCHPAWMTPPSNLYVVAQRVAAGCGNAQAKQSQVADSELAHILLHEIGHAIEQQLLKGSGASGYDMMRAEGFASWFEAYASDYSSIIKDGAVKENYYKLAVGSVRQAGDFHFNGSANDYAHASMYFHAVESKKGVRGVMSLYQIMKTDNLSLYDAIKKLMGWNREKLEEEVLNLLRKANHAV